MRLILDSTKMAEKLKGWRVASSLTQREVVESLSKNYKSIQSLSNWERGLATPPLEVIIELKEIYKVPKNDLINFLNEVCLDYIKNEYNRVEKHLKIS